MDDPYIKLEIGHRGNKATVQLVEVWPEEVEPRSSMALDNMVAWAEEELKKWTEARRTSWDTWQFSSKKEAEKFAIYFNLKWSK